MPVSTLLPRCITDAALHRNPPLLFRRRRRREAAINSISIGESYSTLFIFSTHVLISLTERHEAFLRRFVTLREFSRLICMTLSMMSDSNCVALCDKKKMNSSHLFSEYKHARYFVQSMVHKI